MTVDSDPWGTVRLRYGHDVRQALAVDARQELDLKIGVAFTRHLTACFLPACKAQCVPGNRP